MSLLKETSTTLQEFDLTLPSGRIHAQSLGRDDAPLVICVAGLSANMKSFDFLSERLGGDDARIVSFDLRGRGRSELTPPGTYGWLNHAKDVVAIADALGAERFSIVGQSMGGWVAMACAHLDASRIERVVLLDVAGVPDASALIPIGASVSRLGTVYPSPEEFIGLVRAIGTVEPWTEHWDRYFHYDLVEVDGGVATRSNRQAVTEDGAFGAGATAFGDDAAVYALWRRLTMPVLLLRASREMLPGFGHVVPERERDRFLAAVPTAISVDVDANHYVVSTHEASAREIAAFLGIEPRRAAAA